VVQATRARNSIAVAAAIAFAALLIFAAAAVALKAYERCVIGPPILRERPVFDNASTLRVPLAVPARVRLSDGGLPLVEATLQPTAPGDPTLAVPPGPFPVFPELEASAFAGPIHRVQSLGVGIPQSLLARATVPASPAARPARTTTVTLEYQRLRLHSQMTLPANDRWLRAYELGLIGADDFAAHVSPFGVSGRFSAGDEPVCCGSLRFARNGRSADVGLDVVLNGFESGLPVASGEVAFVRFPLATVVDSGKRVVAGDDLLLFVAGGYQLRGHDIERVDGETESWLHARFDDVPKFGESEREKVALESDPFASFGNFTRWIDANPIYGSGPLILAIARLGGGLVPALVLAAWIFAAARGAPQQTRVPRLRVLALVGVASLPPAYSAAQLLLSRLNLPYGPLRWSGGNVVTTALGTGMTLLVIGAFLVWLARLRGDRRAAPVFAIQLVVLLLIGVAADVITVRAVDRFGGSFGPDPLDVLWYPVAVAVLAVCALVAFAPAIRAAPPLPPRRAKLGVAAVAAVGAACVFVHNVTKPGHLTQGSVLQDGLYAFGPIAFAIAAWLLAADDETLNDASKASRWPAALLVAFACGVPYPTVFGLPLGLALAVPLIAPLLRKTNVGGIDDALARDEVFTEAIRRVDVDRAETAKRALDERVFKDDDDPEKDAKRLELLEGRLRTLEDQRRFPDAIDAETLALGGPMLNDPALAAKRSFFIGAAIGAALVVRDLVPTFRESAGSTLPGLTFLAVLLQGAAWSGLAGAAFALLLHRFHARAGLIKAALVSIALTLAIVPGYVLRGEPGYVFPAALRTLLVLGAVGAYADGWVLWSIRNLKRPWFSVPRLVNLIGLGAYGAVVTLLLTSLGATATGMFTDTVKQLVQRVQSPGGAQAVIPPSK
jgi:hypothetical protein